MITKLKAIRRERGLSQRELAKRTGINYVTISKYETGRVAPGLANVEKIARALGCLVNDLISEDSNAVPDNPANG